MTRRAPTRNVGITVAACVVFVAGMVGASFAAVPLYRLFCQVTGYGGTTQRADTAPENVVDRYVTVRFDANVANGLGWSFRPMQREVRVRLGEIGEAKFFAENRTRTASHGTAGFNVAPGPAGIYFNKMECFCFTEQALQPGESMEMPVTFFVDPAMVDSLELANINTITLSYTFYPAAAPAKPLASATAAPAAAADAL